MEQTDLEGLFQSEDRILSVTEFTKQVKSLMEGHFPAVWIRGEVSNLRHQASGHRYFSIKDARSQLSAVLFRGDVSRQSARLRDGMEIIAFGEISVYEPRGGYQIIVRSIHESGEGRLQLEFEKLKKALADEGLFSTDRKRMIPLFPRTIGFITSPTGAAVRDFISILKRRSWRGRLVVLPVRVQGREASGEVVRMLQVAESMKIFDLLVIGRGGGSLEDLWPFNEEKTVRAISALSVPVISAVGHEIDFTLADFVSDERAETPSAAAELISSRYLEILERLSSARRDLVRQTGNRVVLLLNRMALATRQLAVVSPKNRIEQGSLILDDLNNRLDASLDRQIATIRYRLRVNEERLSAVSPKGTIGMEKLKLKALLHRYDRLRSLSLDKLSSDCHSLGVRLGNCAPVAILKRGFAIVSDKAGRVVTQAGQLQPGQLVETRFSDGSAEMEVKS